MRRPWRIVNFLMVGKCRCAHCARSGAFFNPRQGSQEFFCPKFQYHPLFGYLIVIFSNFQCHLL